MTKSNLEIVSWNIDGISRALQPKAAATPALEPTAQVGLSDLHAALGKPDIFALQEIRLRPVDTTLIQAMERALPGYVCGHSLCHDPINVRFRGGRAYGVATYVREDLCPRWVEPPAWDREGRLVMFELPQLELVVANVYAVNGTSKAYLDPETGHEAGDRHGFKQRFQEHLLANFNSARSRGFELVLIGDWNVSRAAIDTHPRLRTEAPHAAARALLNDRFMPALGVEDVFRAFHPKERAYTWFNRVSSRYGRLDAARVDYALVSSSLMPAVSRATILQEHALRLGSDHAPITLALDEAGLGRGQPSELDATTGG